jgi:hypothetical protein
MRHPSIRGFGIRYVIGCTLPATGIALVVYTAVQLTIALATGTVPPPPVVAQAALETTSLPSEGSNPGAEQTPAEPAGRE